MISGNVRKVTEGKDVVTLRVRGTGCEHYDECDVRIRKDERSKWFKNAIRKTSIKVWWQSDKLFASFGELSGYEFKKVGTTSNFAHI